MYRAEIIEDSVHYRTNERLTTYVLSYPLAIHAELLTHRVFSRNASSNRAIPFRKVCDKIQNDPYLPVYYGSNKRGMQAGDEIPKSSMDQSESIIKEMMEFCIKGAKKLDELGNHKQVVNRYVAPWMFIGVIVTSKDFDNFFIQRCHKDADPAFQKIADMMLEAYINSTPKVKQLGEWHLPFGDRMPEGLSDRDKAMISSGRCARISYENHYGEFSPDEDIRLANDLIKNMHMSPFGHPSVVIELGWKPFRSFIQPSTPKLNHEQRIELLEQRKKERLYVKGGSLQRSRNQLSTNVNK